MLGSIKPFTMFVNLPDLVLDGVLSYLGVQSRVALSATCRTLRSRLHALDPTLGFQRSKVDALTAIEQGKNLFITGSAGTGKTTMLNALISRVSANGRSVRVLTPTHMARQQFDTSACTLHSFARLNHCASVDQLIKRKNNPCIPRCDLLIIDEVSTIDSRIVGLLDLRLQQLSGT